VGAPDGSAYDTNLDAEDESTTDTPMDTTSDHEGGSDDRSADGGVGQVEIHADQLNSIALRRCFALKWMKRQQLRYAFLPIPVHEEPDWEYLRNRWIHGPHGARRTKTAKGKKSLRKFKKILWNFYTTVHIINIETDDNETSGSGPKPSKIYFLIHVMITNVVCTQGKNKNKNNPISTTAATSTLILSVMEHHQTDRKCIHIFTSLKY
jgi:hypothetical protein